MHINHTRTHQRWIKRCRCPDCGRESFFVGFHQEWYGVDRTCLRCGRTWSDGEWVPLPFCRNARRDSIAAAKKRWRRGLDRSEVLCG